MTEANSNACCIEGCSRKHAAKGFCAVHYKTARRRELKAGAAPHILTPKKIVKCSHCGLSFKPRDTRYSAYCSKTCAGAARTARRNEEHPKFSVVYAGFCAACGDAFVSKRKRLYCSDECVPKTTWASVIPETRKCKHCGLEYKPESSGGRPVEYCSDKCQDAGKRETRRVANRLRNKTLGRSSRKRARAAGVEYEPVNKIKVFDRDGWRCQICGKPTPRTRMGGTTATAPELDHRVPLSKGGGHLYSNVQCACRQCNNTKGNKASTGQLPMFDIDGRV